ncbi:uncharacterized protein LOC134252039 [Saccostrea cucullata]|uniref:uncharacterized protein LOC134252039 n=1 Tax=Saccostrea cuccullata TaxID=36930 RepID=UPI002ECFCE84
MGQGLSDHKTSYSNIHFSFQTDGDLTGKCGRCGDYVGGSRPNEAPNGQYASKRSTYIYREGGVINVTVQVTARANGGFFKFKLCKTDSSTAASQACFDQNPLKLANTADQTIIQIPDMDGDIVVPLQLPAGLTCDYCVMQWTWVTARDWRCGSMNGQLVCGMGYGMQPTFVNCADFTILSQSAAVPADFHWPDYNSVYATIHGGHTGSGTTPAPAQTTSNPVIVIPTTTPVTTPAGPATTTPFPIITNPPSTSPAPATTTGAPPTTTDKLIIVTPTPINTTPNPQQTTGPPSSLTTTPPLPQSTEKLIPGPIIPPIAPLPVAPVAAGGSGILGGLSLGSMIAPLGLGLGGLMLLMSMNGRENRGNVEYIDIPPVSMPMISQPVQPMFSPPYVPSFGYTMLPAPVVVPMVEEPVPVKKKGYGKGYGKQGTSYGSNNYRGYGNRGKNYRMGIVNPGYGVNGGGYGYNVQYQQNYKPTSYGNSRPNRGDEQFFQLPSNHAFTRMQYDEEPEVNKVKTKEVIENQPHKFDISAYSKKCPISQQTCKPRYGANEPTVYGAVDIVSMICDLHCSARNPNCPAEMCSCTCKEEPAGKLNMQARIAAASLFGK